MTDNPRKKEPAEPPEATPAEGKSAGGKSAGASIEEQLARAKEDAQKYLGNWQRDVFAAGEVVVAQPIGQLGYGYPVVVRDFLAGA